MVVLVPVESSVSPSRTPSVAAPTNDGDTPVAIHHEEKKADRIDSFCRQTTVFLLLFLTAFLVPANRKRVRRRIRRNSFWKRHSSVAIIATASSSSLYTFRRLGPRSEMSRFSEVGSMAPPHGGRKLLKFLILFENSSLLFFPGQFLSGRVLVELEDETPVLGESPLQHIFQHILILNAVGAKTNVG